MAKDPLELPPVPPKRPNPGSLGGLMASMRMSAEQRSQRSSRAGMGTLRRYGAGYFSALAKAPRKKVPGPKE